ncbi:MAG TPA: YciI family protein [Chthoniobacteraceae bacterium]|nr:YciI family protein [Chthoniobacteraceae bacterium]
MSTQTTKSEYLLLLRGTHWNQDLSPEETQKIMGRMMGWVEQLTREGTIKAAQPLENEGRTVAGRNGHVGTDGPFAESKEAVGGYIIVQAGSIDEAVQIAKQCPVVPYGTVIEVRPIAEECPHAREAGLLATASAGV